MFCFQVVKWNPRVCATNDMFFIARTARIGNLLKRKPYPKPVE